MIRLNGFFLQFKDLLVLIHVVKTLSSLIQICFIAEKDIISPVNLF